MSKMKLTVEEQKDLISDEKVRNKFLLRKDISGLSPKDQEIRWQYHLVALNDFRKLLSKIDGFILSKKILGVKS